VIVKRSIPVWLAIATLSSCNDHGPPAAAYRDWKDQLVVAVGLRNFMWPCSVKEKSKFGVAYASIPLDQCYKMDAPRRWRGVWRNDFEGSQFCPGGSASCGYESVAERKGPIAWLDFAGPLPAELKPRRGGGLYSIDFIGRRTKYRGFYGHAGMSDEAIIVDRIISMEELEAPPKR
jgi:hypothetical protein